MISVPQQIGEGVSQCDRGLVFLSNIALHQIVNELSDIVIVGTIYQTSRTLESHSPGKKL